MGLATRASRIIINMNIYTPPTLPLYSHGVKSLSTLFFYNGWFFGQGVGGFLKTWDNCD